MIRTKHFIGIGFASLLAFTPTGFAKSAKPAIMTEKELTKHFSFRQKQEALANSSERKPASVEDVNDMATPAQQDEQLQILKEFRANNYGDWIVDEMLAEVAAKGSSAKFSGIVGQIPALFAQKLAQKTSRAYKSLRYKQIQSIDGRNHDGGIEFPIKAQDIQVLGPISKNVSLRERCEIDEKDPSKETCSQGWEQHIYLALIPRESCHNSGCDIDPVVYQVEISYIPAIYNGSNMNEDKNRPKVVAGARYAVSISGLKDIQNEKLPSKN